jgi:formyl-CoA transferase
VVGLPVERLRGDPDVVRRRLAELLVTRTSAEWITELRAVAVPCAEVRTLDEVLADPHVEAEGLVADVDHPAIGRYRALGTPIRFGDTPSGPARPSPAFAAHTTAVLRELGLTDAEVDGLVRSGAAVPAVPGPTAVTDRTRSSA